MEKSNIKQNLSFSIENATITDISHVSSAENIIEKGDAASFETLMRRYKMFPAGFIVAKDKNRNIAGYVETTLWPKNKKFETYKEIKNFPIHHKENGKELYVIFIAVKSEFRENGIATQLLDSVETLAQKISVERIVLAAKKHLVPFYEKRGFHTVKELPRFLPDKDYGHFLMEKILN